MECEVCQANWVAEMNLKGKLRIKLCAKHAENLLEARKDKSGNRVVKLLKEWDKE